MRYRTRTSRVNGRLATRGGALCRRRAGGGRKRGGTAGSVGYVLAHVRNCGHLSRKREAGGNPDGGWREAVIRVWRERERISSCGEDVSPRSRG